MQRHCLVSEENHSESTAVHIIGRPCTYIQNAIRSSFKRDSDANVWYSFMAPGNTVRDEEGLEIITQSYESTDCEVFDEIEEALSQISYLFKSLFSRTYTSNQFDLYLINRGSNLIESGTSIPSDYYADAYSMQSGTAVTESVGDIRVSMVPVDGLGFTLAYAYTHGMGVNITGDVGGDVRFDHAENWRDDSDVHLDDRVSLGYVALHEFLHTFGMGHDSTPNSIMRPSISNEDSLVKLFPGGLTESPEFFTVHKAYAGTPLSVALGGRQIYRLDGTSIIDPHAESKQVWDGALDSVSVSPSGYVWGTGTNDLVWFRRGVSADTPFGDGWVRVDGRLQKVQAGALVVGLNENGDAYVRNGISEFIPDGLGWSRILGQKLDSICCSPAAYNGNLSLFGTHEGSVYFREGVSFGRPTGTIWKKLNGARAIEIAMGWFGKLVLCLNWHGKLYRRVGITENNPGGSDWTQIYSPIALKSVSVSPTGEVYGIARTGDLLHRVGVSSNNLSGKTWVPTNIRNIDKVTIGFEIA
jgi:hypothetical protein